MGALELFLWFRRVMLQWVIRRVIFLSTPSNTRHNQAIKTYYSLITMND